MVDGGAASQTGGRVIEPATEPYRSVGLGEGVVLVDLEGGRARKAGVLGLLFGLGPAVLDGDLDTGSAHCFSQGGVGGLRVRTAVE